MVLDEVHYLQDAYRGPVWEEVIIHLAAPVRLVCLSATVSNAEELAEWICRSCGAPRRRSSRSAGRSSSSTSTWSGTRARGAPPPPPDPGRRAAQPRGGPLRRGGGAGRRPATGPAPGAGSRPTGSRWSTAWPRRTCCPAIYFIFSRAACDDAVRTCLDAGVRLTTAEERARITRDRRGPVAALGDDDLDVLGYGRWLGGLEAGVAAHHAGMVPPFKEAVEACFVDGLVKVVFATETLALGINMPARAVVIEKSDQVHR